MHEQWRPVKESLRSMLDDTTIAQLVAKEREIDAAKKSG